jgi:aspartyl aminopeptidase
LKKINSEGIMPRWDESCHNIKKWMHRAMMSMIVARWRAKSSPRNSIKIIIHHHNSHHLRRKTTSEVERSRATKEGNFHHWD